MTDEDQRPLPKAEDVLRFLEANPDFLIDQRLTANPGGETSRRVISLSQETIRRAQDAIRFSSFTQRNMADITAANTTSQARVFQAACLLMAAQSSEDIITAINDHLPEILDIHAARLVVTEENALTQTGDVIIASEKDMASMSEEAKSKDGTYRLGVPNSAQMKKLASLMPNAETSTALAILPSLPGEKMPPMWLILIGQDTNTFTPGQGTELLAFTVTLIAIALRARDSDA